MRLFADIVHRPTLVKPVRCQLNRSGNPGDPLVCCLPFAACCKKSIQSGRFNVWRHRIINQRMPLRIPDTLRGGLSWNPSLSDNEIAILLVYLHSQNFKAISNIVARKLNLDTRSRVEADNRLNLKDGGHWLREARTINKALAMELLVALSMTYIDNSERVVSGCVVRNQQPNNFASSGLADITVFYPRSDDGQAFSVLVEVSLKRNVSAEHYRRQLDQTLTHAKVLAANHNGRQVYGLVINSGDITREKRLQSVYKRFLLDNRITADSHIKVLALYTGDFISIMGKLLVDKTYDFRSSLLVQIFDILIERLREKVLPLEKDWVEQTWLNIVNESRFLKLELNKQSEE